MPYPDQLNTTLSRSPEFRSNSGADETSSLWRDLEAEADHLANLCHRAAQAVETGAQDPLPVHSRIELTRAIAELQARRATLETLVA